MLTNNGNILMRMESTGKGRLQEVPVCQGHTLKSCDTIPHEADLGATKGS